MTMLRTFIAVPLPATIVDELGRVQRLLARQVAHGAVRWVRPRGIHLTLKFLGETPSEDVAKIEAALAAVSRNAPAFNVKVGGTGCFPNPRRPRVVWIGLDEPTGRLVRLQQAVEEAVAAVGFPPERRRFTPHLTLGRIGRRANRRDATHVGELVASQTCGSDLGQMFADRVALIRSVLKPTGAEYTTLASFLLRES